MRTAILLLTIMVCGAGHIYSQNYQLGQLTTSVTDASRSNRSIPVEIFYPANVAGNGVPLAGGPGVKFPVLVFGHGFSMNYDAYSNFWTRLIPEGYIMVFPKTEIGPIPFPSHPDLAKDMVYMVDWFLAQGATQSSIFFNKVSGKSAVMGHSMGGGCSFLAAPQSPNINAIAVFAPAETNPSAIAAAANSGIPALVFAGSKDCVAPPASNQLPMYNALTSQFKTYVNITNGSHCQFAESNFLCNFGESTACPFTSYISRTAQHNVQFSLLIPWLDFVLKGECDQYTNFQNLLTAASGFTWQQVSNVSLPVATINPSANPFQCVPQPLTLSAAPSGLNYLWSTASTSSNIVVSQAGVYSVIATNSYNCSDTAFITVTLPADTLAMTLSKQDVSCSGQSNGIAWAEVTGGFGTNQIAWSVGNQVGDTAFQLAAGTYTVTVTDSLGCTTVDAVVIDEPTPLNLSILTDSATCNGSPDGRAIAFANGGTAPYAYSWSSGQTGTADTLNNLAQGNYSLTLTDGNNCTITSAFLIEGPSQLSVALGKSDITCFGASDGRAWAMANGGTLPYQFFWNQGPGADTITNLLPGTYAVTVIDQNNCAAGAAIVVDEPAALSLALAIDSVSCNSFTDGRAQVSVSGGTFPYQYSWSSTGSFDTLLVAGAGQYQFSATDANGCTIDSLISIFEPSPLGASYTVSNASCGQVSNGSAVAIANGGNQGYSFQWSDGSTGPQLTNVLSGPYFLTISDIKGCTFLDSILVGEDTLVPPFLTPTNAQVCQGAAATFQVSGSYASYRWSNNDTLPDLTTNVSGSYWVMVTDANGCTLSSDTVVLTVFTPYLDLGIIVRNDSIVLNEGTGLQWTIDSSIVATNVNAIAYNGFGGRYQVTVNDSNGCTYLIDTLIISTGIGNTLTTAIAIYPNPCNDRLHVPMTSPELPIFYTLDGAAISLPVLSQGTVTTFDTSMLPSGIYYLHFPLKGVRQKLLVLH